MMKKLPKEIVIFDTEFTTWRGAMERNWDGPNEYREIVQIGAIKFNTKKFNEEDSFSVLIKPVKNPELSDYFSELTGIKQSEVDIEGLSLKEALKKFFLWAGNLNFYSYGTDWPVIKENCQLLKLDPEIEDSKFFDIRDVFKDAGIDTSNYMSSTIPKAFGARPPKNAHDALNDARSIALALRAMN